MSDFDYDRQQFPEATRAHWKVLLREINLKRAGHARNLAAAPDLKDFSGVRIEKDNSLVTFGSNMLTELQRAYSVLSCL